MRLKSGDQWTVPLCRRHHDQVEDAGDEAAWWQAQGINPIPLAQELWAASRAAAENGLKVKRSGP